MFSHLLPTIVDYIPSNCMPEEKCPHFLPRRGKIGNSIAAAIRSQGHAYRVVGCNQAQLEKCFGADPLAESVTWNSDDPASVRSECRGVDTLIYWMGLLKGGKFH